MVGFDRSGRLIVAAPFVFALHDLEEAVFADQMNDVARGTILRVFPSAQPRVLDAVTMSREEVVTAAGLFFCFEATACAIVFCARRPRRSVEVLAAILYARLLNGAQHLVLSVFAHKYPQGRCLRCP